MTAAVLYNDAKTGGFLKDDALYIKDAIATVERIVDTLNKGGHTAFSVKITKTKMEQQLRSLKNKVDVVFNLTESLGLGLVIDVINTLDRLQIPYAGANAKGHLMTSNKKHVKAVLERYGIPTPKAFFFGPKDKIEVGETRFPMIVKATTEHGSMSIRQDSIANDLKELKKKVTSLLEKYGGKVEVMAEEYIAGREINSTVIGCYEWAKCLPLSEVVFKGIYEKEGVWPIYTYEAKYNHGEPEFEDAPARIVDWLSPEEIREIEEMSVKICQLTECFDYARTDIRYDTENRIPYLIDLNSYPCLLDEPATDTISISRVALGWNYLKILEEIAKSAINKSLLHYGHKEDYANETLNNYAELI